jgi:dephospho-CoA kinase
MDTIKIIIGLTGTYCAGKNYVALLLEEKGIPSLELDMLGHQAIEAEKDLILSRFGEDILGKGGHIDRRKLGRKVFGNPKELAALEEIIHPWVNSETLSWIEARVEKACVINAALIHRSSVFNLLDAIIIVEAPYLVRLLRARKRDKLPWSLILKRFRSQSDFDSQYLKEKTDIYRVGNPSFYRKSRRRLEAQINEILSLQGI